MRILRQDATLTPECPVLWYSSTAGLPLDIKTGPGTQAAFSLIARAGRVAARPPAFWIFLKWPEAAAIAKTTTVGTSGCSLALAVIAAVCLSTVLTRLSPYLVLVVLTGDTDELVAYIPARRMRVFVPPGLMGLASPAGPTGAGSVPAPLPVVHAVQKLNPHYRYPVDFEQSTWAWANGCTSRSSIPLSPDAGED